MSLRLTLAVGSARHCSVRQSFSAKLLLLGTLLIGVLFLSGCSHQFSGLIFDDPAPVAEIAGPNYDGDPFSLEAEAGKMTLIFFGYTYCPDICPLTLAEMVGARRIIQQEDPELAQDLNLLFVSVDPERDTLSRMREYLTVFDPTLYGVRLEGENLTEVKSAYGIYGEIDDPPADEAGAESGQPDEGYTVTHTGSLFLMDRQNRLKAIYKSDVPAAILAEDLMILLGQ